MLEEAVQPTNLVLAIKNLYNTGEENGQVTILRYEIIINFVDIETSCLVSLAHIDNDRIMVKLLIV